MDGEEIRIDVEAHEAIIAGRRILLTPIETGILSALLKNPNSALSRRELLSCAAGSDSPTSERAIDVHVSSLRGKLGDAGKQIETVRGQGYCYAAS